MIHNLENILTKLTNIKNIIPDIKNIIPEAIEHEDFTDIDPEEYQKHITGSNFGIKPSPKQLSRIIHSLKSGKNVDDYLNKYAFTLDHLQQHDLGDKYPDSLRYIASSPKIHPNTANWLLKNINTKQWDHRTALFNLLANNNLPPDILSSSLLHNHIDNLPDEEQNLSAHRSIAANHNTPPDLLNTYLNWDDTSIAATAAGNPALPKETMDAIFDQKNKEKHIFSALLHNPALPLELQQKVINLPPKEKEIHLHDLAANTNIHPSIQNHIIDFKSDSYKEIPDAHAEAANTLLQNNTTEPHILHKIFNEFPYSSLSHYNAPEYLLKNTNTHPDTIHQIINKPYFRYNNLMALHAINNPNVSKETLTQLTQYYDKDIAKHANKKLNKLAKAKQVK